MSTENFIFFAPTRVGYLRRLLVDSRTTTVGTNSGVAVVFGPLCTLPKRIDTAQYTLRGNAPHLFHRLLHRSETRTEECCMRHIVKADDGAPLGYCNALFP